MQVAPNIHRIQAPLGDCFVCVDFLVGTGCALLVDTGIDSTPHTYIAPYLESIGMAPARIRYVITSHSDFDHTAGNGALAQLAPQALFLCHALDRPMVEDIELMISDRYGEFGADHGVDESDESKYQVDIRIFGNAGTLLLDVERERVEVRRHDGRNTQIAVAPNAGDYECDGPPQRFVALMQGQGRNDSPGEVAARSVEMIDAMLRSAERGGQTEPVAEWF